MKWLAVALLMVLLALAAFPATVGAVGALIGHRGDSAQSISYISRGIHEMEANRRRASFQRKLNRLSSRHQS